MTYLAPLPPSPTESDAFVDLLGAAIAGVTGLPGNLVRPSWQPNPPLRPGPEVNWCGFRLLNMTADADPVMTVDDDGMTFERSEDGQLFVTMYGPLADAYAGILRDGLEVPFNREALRAQGIATGAASAKNHLPELVDDIWYERVDITFEITRDITRTYLILPLVSAAGGIRANGPDPALEIPFSVHQ